MAINPPTTAPPKVSPVFKAALKLQVFLLRRDMMGKMGQSLMVITTTGRRTGKQHSTPIAFVQDGTDICAINRGGWSNWFKNVRANGKAMLEFGKQKVDTAGRQIIDPAHIDRVFELYRNQQKMGFPRIFGCAWDASPEELRRGRDQAAYVCFTPKA